jgi:hypothetical protein
MLEDGSLAQALQDTAQQHRICAALNADVGFAGNGTIGQPNAQ